MTKPLTAIIRADDHSNMGGGHIIRCSNLARELQDKGFEITWASTEETFKRHPHLATEKHIALPQDVEEEQVYSMLQNGLADTTVLITDGYHLTNETHEYAALSSNCLIVSIDERLLNEQTDRMLLPDLYFSFLEQDAQEYYAKGKLPPTTEIYAGEKFQMTTVIPKKISKLRKAWLEKDRKGEKQKVILMNGNYDLGAMIPWTLSIAAMFPHIRDHIDIDIYTRSGDGKHLKLIQDRIEEVKGKLTAKVITDQGSPEILRAMAESDFVVSSAGYTPYEAGAMGLPGAFAAAGHNQVEIAERVERFNSGVNFGPYLIREVEGKITKDTLCHPSAFKMVDALTTLIHNQEAVAEFTKNASAFCDGKGAERVAEIIFHAAIARRNGPVARSVL